MPSKNLKDNEFIAELTAVLNEKKADSDGLYISTVTLKNELSTRGITCSDQELAAAVNRLLALKMIRLIWLCFEDGRLGAELEYPANF